MTLLEVLLSTVVLGIALTGFLMALATGSTTSKMATDESQLTYLASVEFEALRGTENGKIPFVQTSEAGHVEQVPDYFNDIAISNEHGGNCQIVASGDLSTYTRDLAFDGKRANENSRWMGAVNALAPANNGGGPSGGGPSSGGGPGGGGPGGGPGGGGSYAPSEYQYIYCAFPSLTPISRILYDNRFNATEIQGAPLGDFDYLVHDKNVWQRNYDFFWSDRVLGFGEVYDPWNQTPEPLDFFDNGGYGSAGIHMIYPNFHWPYASEIEAYGFNQATAFTESTAATEFDNVIMYFPNYLKSGFDLGRRSYVTAPSLDEAQAGHGDLLHVIIEFYPADRAHDDVNWQKDTWWNRDNNEIARFQTSFYRDAPTRIDTLPNLHDYPKHQVYDNNEDLTFPFSVPGATSIRAHFNVFDLEPNPGTDEVTIEDASGQVYGLSAFGHLAPWWTEWVPGDTIVVHFKSNGSLNSYDTGYGGFAVDSVEVGSVDQSKLN
jgi:type II secretory pathway pseudopilin PulG